MNRWYHYIAMCLVVSLLLGFPVAVQAVKDTDSVEILKIHSEGQEVVNLQMRLRDLGYFNYKVTGYYATATAAAVRNFHERNGLASDGTVGPETLEVLYSCDVIREEVVPGDASGLLPVSRGGRTSMGQMVEWFSSGQYLFPRGAVAKVIDLCTGISFTMQRTGGSYHADSEPVSTADTNKIKQ